MEKQKRGKDTTEDKGGWEKEEHDEGRRKYEKEEDE